jgi:hypothetical protein
MQIAVAQVLGILGDGPKICLEDVEVRGKTNIRCQGAGNSPAVVVFSEDNHPSVSSVYYFPIGTRLGKLYSLCSTFVLAF